MNPLLMWSALMFIGLGSVFVVGATFSGQRSRASQIANSKDAVMQQQRQKGRVIVMTMTGLTILTFGAIELLITWLHR